MLDQVCFPPQKFSLFIVLFLATNPALVFEDEAAPKRLSGKQQKDILPISSSWQVLAGQQSCPVASCRRAEQRLGASSRFSLRSHPVPRSSIAFLGASPLFPRCRIGRTTISSAQTPGSESQGEAKPPWHQEQSQVSPGTSVTQIMKKEK